MRYDALRLEEMKDYTLPTGTGDTLAGGERNVEILSTARATKARLIEHLMEAPVLHRIKGFPLRQSTNGGGSSS